VSADLLGERVALTDAKYPADETGTQTQARRNTLTVYTITRSINGSGINAPCAGAKIQSGSAVTTRSPWSKASKTAIGGRVMVAVEYPTSHDRFSVYLDVVAQSASASVFFFCLLSLLIWWTTGLVIVNPFISVVLAAGSLLFFVMGSELKKQRIRAFQAPYRNVF
jgi:hypothetical protein